jgi:hypothetical protein
MNHVRAFIAGFLSTLVFHQGVLLVFHVLGAFPRAPWSLAPVPPFGVPMVLSLAFWGGVWGMPIAWLIRNAAGTAYFVRAMVFGAIGPSAVALFVVFPMKGMGVAGGWDPKIIVGALIVNGVWGLGLALLLRWLRKAGL